ncbi:MAG: hypothetical protein HY579_04990 [Nitrospinae bacterium]|nr:hypothetical protein [Nitrospinota bacterium]
MKREENAGRSLDEIAMDIQWNLRKLSAALDRYSGYEPFAPQRTRDIKDYPGPASKNMTPLSRATIRGAGQTAITTAIRKKNPDLRKEGPNPYKEDPDPREKNPNPRRTM